MAGYLAVGTLLVVIGLGVTGIVDVPGFGGPAIPDAHGHGETVGTLSLASVEDEYVRATDADGGD